MNGDPQSPCCTPSTRQPKVDPGTLEVNEKVGVRSRVSPDGPSVIVVSGPAPRRRLDEDPDREDEVRGPGGLEFSDTVARAPVAGLTRVTPPPGLLAVKPVTRMSPFVSSVGRIGASKLGPPERAGVGGHERACAATWSSPG